MQIICMIKNQSLIQLILLIWLEFSSVHKSSNLSYIYIYSTITSMFQYILYTEYILTDITTNKYTMDNNNNETKLIKQDHRGHREYVCIISRYV